MICVIQAVVYLDQHLLGWPSLLFWGTSPGCPPQQPEQLPHCPQQLADQAGLHKYLKKHCQINSWSSCLTKKYILYSWLSCSCCFSGVEVTNTTNTLNHVDVRWVDWSCQHFYQNVVCTKGGQIYILQPGNQKKQMWRLTSLAKMFVQMRGFIPFVCLILQ